MTQINPYLHFDGNCREAMTFYKECLGGELVVQSVGESPMAGQMSAGEQKKILHAQLKIDGATLMASDMTGPGGLKKGNEISLTIVCSSKAEIESFFSKMSAGGKVTHPLKEEFFGWYGDLTDKYGINWMFNCETPKNDTHLT
jgi:PhnB protein